MEERKMESGPMRCSSPTEREKDLTGTAMLLICVIITLFFIIVPLAL